MMRLDPSEEDSDDSANGGRESPVGEGQMVDLEVTFNTSNNGITQVWKSNHIKLWIHPINHHLRVASLPWGATSCWVLLLA